MYIYIRDYVHIDIQPVPPAVTFSQVFSKLKAQRSNVSFATFP